LRRHHGPRRRIDKTVAATRDLDEVNRLIKKLRDVESLIFDRR
jgi:hypothetical protein